MMKKILRIPYLVFLLGSALLMIVIEVWSFVQSDRLIINQAFLIFLFFIPVLAVLYLIVVRRYLGKQAHISWIRWIVRWVGNTALGLLAAFIVFMAFGVLVPYNPTPTYNYPHFYYSYYVGGKQLQVTPGEKALDETLYDLDGNEMKLSELWNKRPIVIEFGSITCPVFCSNISAMETLAKEYSAAVDFYVLYVREAHPGQNYPEHKSFSEKLTNANDLQRSESVERTILIDSFDGAMNRDYGAMPNSVYIIGKDGIISYRADWADPDQVEKQLDILLANEGNASQVEPINVTNNFARPDQELLTTTKRVLSRSGFAAISDFIMSFPNMLQGRTQAYTER